MKSELSVRKAGENVDDAQWKDTIQLQKDEEEFFPGTRVRRCEREGGREGETEERERERERANADLFLVI